MISEIFQLKQILRQMKDKQKERPELPAEILEGISTPAEDFQNKILRPIIKMQSDLLIAHLQNKLITLKINLTKLSLDKQEATLTGIFSNDQAFKREIIGMVIGHFTLDEYKAYLELNKEINRRITQIVLNRCLDLLVAKN